LPGVEAVVTADDFPNPRASQARRFLIGNFLAVDKVVFHGHPVAAVAAARTSLRTP
jgi:CO/xanthine dehydrogenase Mo-binding subunit